MATDITKISGDQFDVYIAGNLVTGIQSLSFPPFAPTLRDIKSIDTGDNVLGQMVNGYEGEITIETQYRTRDELLKYCPFIEASGVTDVPAPGSVLAPVSVRIHNKNDANTTNDIVFLAVTFRVGSPTSDGKDEATYPLIGKLCLDASGAHTQIGYSAS